MVHESLCRGHLSAKLVVTTRPHTHTHTHTHSRSIAVPRPHSSRQNLGRHSIVCYVFNWVVQYNEHCLTMGLRFSLSDLTCSYWLGTVHWDVACTFIVLSLETIRIPRVDGWGPPGRLTDWLSCRSTPHSTPTRSFRRCSPEPISCLGMEKN